MKLTERHVQAIWYDAALRPAHLVTRRGSDVAVVSPGEWNLGAGPDFRGAVLELGRERRRVVGDVEVHLCPADWDFHGHGADPNYRNVIAHVTWGCGPTPVSLPPGAVSIWLGRFMTAETSFAPEQIDLTAYPLARLPIAERPCERVLGHDPDLARQVLEAAGRHRLRLKARRLQGRLAAAAEEARRVGSLSETEESVAEGRRQVFYEEVLMALGYTKNTAAFRGVARRLPLVELPDDVLAARRAFLTAGAFETWIRDSLRPYNTPEVRLAHAAEIVTETPTLALADAVDFDRRACREMVRGMGGAKRPTGRCLGAGRAAAVLANVIVPFALAEGRLGEAPDWLPPEDISAPVRLTAFRLFGRDHNPAAWYATNGLLIQGLLQIHRDCCLQHHPECEGCRLPKDGCIARF